MLMIWRSAGKGAFIGRATRVTVLGMKPDEVSLAIEAPFSVAVSGPPTTAEEHLTKVVDRERDSRERTWLTEHSDIAHFTLRKGDVVQVGRSVKIEYSGMNSAGMATLGIDAPRNVAISRDDFTKEQHMDFQERREAGAVSEV